MLLPLLLPSRAAEDDEAKRKAFVETKARAEKGEAEAQFSLAEMYVDGHGVEQDYVESFKWLRRAAEKGNVNAQEWLRRSAENGHIGSQVFLGGMYTNGQGVETNYVEAFKWFRRAADKGDANAQRNLGAAYLVGRGVEKDYVEALKWNRRAADQGNPFAQWNLGYSYDKGFGVEKDCVEAYAWFNLASVIDADSAKYRDELEKKMSPQQVAEGIEAAGAGGRPRPRLRRVGYANRCAGLCDSGRRL